MVDTSNCKTMAEAMAAISAKWQRHPALDVLITLMVEGGGAGGTDDVLTFLDVLGDKGFCVVSASDLEKVLRKAWGEPDACVTWTEFASANYTLPTPLTFPGGAPCLPD